MDSKEFVTKLKREAVDGTVEAIMRNLKSPRQFNFSNAQTRESQRKSTWFDELGDDGRKIVRDLLEECAELATFSVTTFIDGVGGETEGVFEIVYVVDEERKVLNPENSEMLHDLLSDVCESGRQHRNS